MASQVDIANLALTLLGAARITDLAENSKSGRAMTAVYETTRRAMLRRAWWKHALKRDSLPAMADDPTVWGYGYRYQLPPDFIRLVQVHDTFAVPAQTDYVTQDDSLWSLENGKILTDLGAPLKIRYVFDNQDPGTYDDLFVQCFADELAFRSCEEITNSTQKREAIRETYKADFLEAARAGAMELPPQSIADDSWVVARL